ITGGGFHENVPRALPEGLGAEVERGAWPEQPVFSLVQASAGASDDDMFATFNMGVGMVLVVDPDDADHVLDRAGETAYRIGRVVGGPGVHLV
ncbi:MAG TPA: AIR synthase-related protein, partial [Actinomycetota bacterium]